MNKRVIELKEGMILQCDTLRWDDGWEFDCPSMMISPVIRCYEDGSCHENIVEDVLIDGVINEKIQDEDFDQTWNWRGYKLSTLKRRFQESLKGKFFPKANYRAERSRIKIVKEKGGTLSWIDLPN